MSDVASLTRPEAEERAALLAVDRYDIAVDLRGLLDGEVVRVDLDDHASRCREPGASTFVDCVAEIRARHASTAPTLDLGDRRATAGCRCPTWPRTTSSS